MGRPIPGIKSILLSFYLLLGESHGLPGTCSSPGVECEYDASSHLDTVMHVQTVEECHQLCLDQEYCEFITYYSTSTHVQHMCMLFRSCENTSSCGDQCVTDWIECDRSCFESKAGNLDENVIEVIPNTMTGQDCRDLCGDTEGCTWFTYFLSDDPLYHEHCFLLSEKSGNQDRCDFCVSGPVDCQQTMGCGLSYEGDDKRQDALVITSPDITSVNIHGGSGIWKNFIGNMLSNCVL